MSRKRWIAREDVSHRTDASRTRQVAVLKSTEKSTEEQLNLNSNQRMLVKALAATGGRLALDDLRKLAVPRSTLGTLVKRGLVNLVDEAMQLPRPDLSPNASRGGFDFNPSQGFALDRIRAATSARKFAGILLHGVTGSGKTAVDLAAMKSRLDERKSAILLV